MSKDKKHPMHHIGACVFLELFIKPRKRKSWVKECRAYLDYKLGKYYHGTLSILAFGEIAKTLASIEHDGEWFALNEQGELFTKLVMILKRKHIQFWSPQFNCMKKALELQEEFQFEPADTLHLSCASEDNACSIFVTTEENFE